MKLDLYNNPIMRALTRVADLMLLNMLFLLCSVPIITIGASATAMYTITIKMVRGEEAYIIKGFFAAIKVNFKRATIAWIFLFLFGAVIVFNFLILNQFPAGILQTMIRFVLMFATIVFGMVNAYVLPLLARFDQTVKQTFQNAILIAISKLPYTLVLLVIPIIAVFITLLNDMTFSIGMLFWVLMGFATIALLNSTIYRKVFEQFETVDEEVVEESTEEKNENE